MSDGCFHVGDRVRVSAVAAFHAGRLGTIVASFIGEDDLYDVQFDGERSPYLMLSRELKHAYSRADAGLDERQVGA